MAPELQRKCLHLPTALEKGLDQFQDIRPVSVLDDLRSVRSNILVLTDEGWEYFPGAQVEPYQRFGFLPVPDKISIRSSTIWKEVDGKVSSRILLRPRQRVVPVDRALAIGYDLYYRYGTGRRRDYLMD